MEDFNEYLQWLKNTFESDTKEVNENNLKYLKNTYEYLYGSIANLDKDYLRKYVSLFDKDNGEKFKKYIINKKKEYSFMSKRKSSLDIINYFSNLASWYKNTYKGLEKVVLNLSRNNYSN